MSFGYSQSLRTFQKRSLLVAMGIVGLPLSFHFHSATASLPAAPAPSPTVPPDPRVTRLHKFFLKLHCPVAGMAQDFIQAADSNHLDWRLLPSIAVIESGGGKAYKHNNIFGWNGGEQSFATIRSGLELVAYRLGRGPLYKRHDSQGKLRIYNKNEDYPGSVMAVMNRISPEANLRSVADFTRPHLSDFAEVRY